MKDSLTFVEEQRARALRADPELEIVEEERVFCGPCKKWISLDKRPRFRPAKWYKHKQRRNHIYHAGALPPGRVRPEHQPAARPPRALREQERAAALEADPDVGAFHSAGVFCRLCDKWVALHKNGPKFATYGWTSHKASQKHIDLSREIQTNESSVTSNVHTDVVFDVDDVRSTAPSPSIRYTPPMELPGVSPSPIADNYPDIISLSSPTHRGPTSLPQADNSIQASRQTTDNVPSSSQT